MQKKSVFGPIIVEKVAFIVTFFQAMSSLYPLATFEKKKFWSQNRKYSKVIFQGDKNLKNHQ